MVGLVPISFFYFLHAVHKRGFLVGWLAFSSPTTIFFLWVSTTLLLVSHLSSLILAFGGRADKISRSTIWLCFIPFFCWPTSPSIASYGLLLLAVSVTARCLWTSESIHQVWLEQKTGSVAHMLSRFLLGLKPLVQFALYMLPVYFVLMGYYLAQAWKTTKLGITAAWSGSLTISGALNRSSILPIGIFLFIKSC